MALISSQLIRRNETAVNLEQLAERSHHSILLTSEILSESIENADMKHLGMSIDETLLNDQYLVFVQILDENGAELLTTGDRNRVGQNGFVTFEDEIVFQGERFGTAFLTWNTAFVEEIVDQRVTEANRLINVIFLIMILVILGFGHYLIARPLDQIGRRIQTLLAQDPSDVAGLQPFEMSLSKEWSYLSDTTNLLQAEIIKRQKHEEDLSIARDAALESSRLKTEFLTNISHEFRTPLNGILGLSQLLTMTDLDEEQLDYVQSIYDSGSDLQNIVENTLNFSQVEQGEVELSLERFDLADLVDETLGRYRLLAAEKGIELNYEIEDGGSFEIYSDSRRCQQAIGYLVDNGVKFTAEGHVTVSVSRPGPVAGRPTYRIEITDTGLGIPADKVDQIFNPFVQIDGSLTRQHGGNGLGLSLAQGIVKSLGGIIEVKSQPSIGSTFSLTLPATTPVTEIIPGNVSRVA